MEVRLGLAAVAQNIEVVRVRLELLAEVEDGPVRPTGANDVAETADEAFEPEALYERRDHRFAGELARAVEGDGQASEVHLAARVRNVAVDRPAGREDE